MSSAICLVGLLMFAATGLTLNNASFFEAREPRTERTTATIPAPVLKQLTAAATEKPSELPAEVAAWLSAAARVSTAAARLEWSDDELSIPVPRPGGSASLRIDLKSGQLEIERIDRGAVAYLNDLHKGRHAGQAWSWFIDIFAVAALISALSGLLILVRQSSMRRSVWPLVALGLAIPVAFAVFAAH